MRKPRNILVMTYWSFADALIQTYTLPYVKIIQQILPPESELYLFTLEKDKSAINAEALRKVLHEHKINWIPQPYEPFGIKAMVQWITRIFKIRKLIITHRIDTLHCWCTPAGAAGYLLSLLTGKRLIIDSYEPHAEAMVENGTWKKNSVAYRVLFSLEKKQTERAACLIAVTSGMRDYALQKYGIAVKNFFVKPTCVDLNIFSEAVIKNETLLKQLGFVDKIVCVYAGKFGGIYLEKEVFEFFKVAADFWKDSFRILLLSNHSQKQIEEWCRQVGLDPSIITIRFLSHAEVPQFMGLADFAITPVKPVPTKRYCSPIKNGEYWALGLPVVIPKNISDDSDIILKNDIGAVLKSLDSSSYLASVQKINELLATPRLARQKKIRQIAEQNRNFQIAVQVYEKIYGEDQIMS